VAWWELAGLASCAAAFVALRLPLYRQPGIFLGWHSDAALLGLMARAIEAGDYPLLFWGCDYLAPLTSVFAAIVGTTALPEIGPLALRLGVAIEVFAALVFFHFALRRAVSRRAALLSTFWLAAGPAFLFKLTYAPLSAEQYFFLGAVAFWYVATRRFTRLHQWLILGLLAGAGIWIHRGVLLVIVPSLLVIALYDARRAPLRSTLVGAIVFAIGVVLGYFPAILGRYDLDQRLYIPVKMLWRIEHVTTRFVEMVSHDLWMLIGADTAPLGWLLGAALIALLVSAIVHFEPRRETMLAAAIVAVCLAFWVFSNETYRGAVRYIMVALPILYAFAAQEIVRLWDGRGTIAGVALAILIAAALFIPRWKDAGEVAAARREQHERWPGGFDPRPSLRAVAEGRYVVCYADVWIAHKLEWLSEPTVRFIPYRSVNRRMVDSLRLGALPGPKCFVDLQGNVHPLTARQQNDLRVETLWHMYAWPRRTTPVPW
jgi:hypothetical protein